MYWNGNSFISKTFEEKYGDRVVGVGLWVLLVLMPVLGCPKKISDWHSFLGFAIPTLWIVLCLFLEGRLEKDSVTRSIIAYLNMFSPVVVVTYWTVIQILYYEDVYFGFMLIPIFCTAFYILVGIMKIKERLKNSNP